MSDVRTYLDLLLELCCCANPLGAPRAQVTPTLIIVWNRLKNYNVSLEKTPSHVFEKSARGLVDPAARATRCNWHRS